ncbi:hypothetical protein ACJX0J_032567, partial [Zea mays]
TVKHPTFDERQNIHTCRFDERQVRPRNIATILSPEAIGIIELLYSIFSLEIYSFKKT